jgi:hypothetical protein
MDYSLVRRTREKDLPHYLRHSGRFQPGRNAFAKPHYLQTRLCRPGKRIFLIIYAIQDDFNEFLHDALFDFIDDLQVHDFADDGQHVIDKFDDLQDCLGYLGFLAFLVAHVISYTIACE